jgi:hypothetical protein
MFSCYTKLSRTRKVFVENLQYIMSFPLLCIYRDYCCRCDVHERYRCSFANSDFRSGVEPFVFVWRVVLGCLGWFDGHILQQSLVGL